MKEIKKFIALLVAVCMVLAFVPANIAKADVSYSVNFGTGTFSVDGKNVTASLDGGSTVVTGTQEISYTASIKLTGFDPDAMQVKVQASDGFNTTLTVSEDGTTSLSQRTNDGGLPISLTFVVESKNNNGGDNPGPAPEEGNDFEFEMNFAGSDIIVSIEGREVNMESDKFDLEEYSFSGTVNLPGTNDSSETNLMHFRPRYGDHPLKEVTINGTKYTAESPEVEISGRFGEEWDITVPGDRHYTIDGIADMDALVPRTIIWTNPDYVPKDEEDAEWVKNFSIEHGSARLIEMTDGDGNPVEIEDNGLKDGFGWVEVLPGYDAVFEFYPEYGYQLTEISLNETPMDASNVSNQFTISIPNDDASNVHFAAKFTETEDIVKAGAEAVSEGSIALGNELDGGSAQLLVNDVTVSSEKTEDFEEAAGEYDIYDYLDIDLNQVFYKGKNDADDVWANPMEDLDEAATITLKLEDDFEAEDVVLVHNIHDGEEFEVIEVDSYNPETNEITFKTDSFSNFAIAKKEEKKEDKKEETKVEGTKFSTYEGNTFYKDDKGDVRAYDKDGKLIRDEFKCDGTYTYYLQFDGTAMKDRLTYHPDGVHIIYLDSEGHEVFSDFAHVKKSIAGEEVDDFCFFDVFGYMYVDKITWDKTGTVLYYANPYGVMEVGKWFQFSDTVTWGDGTECESIAGGYGYASEDATLMRDQWTYDWEGRFCYMQGNGVALY